MKQHDKRLEMNHYTALQELFGQKEEVRILTKKGRDTGKYKKPPTLAQFIKSLRLLEIKARRQMTDECNGESKLTEEQEEEFCDKIRAKVLDILPHLPPDKFFINGDPRGYCLKLREGYSQELQNKGHKIQTDWGGYCMIAWRPKG